MKKNIYQQIPVDTPSEVFEILVDKGDVKIERIISRGHKSPDKGWYNQDREEWVMVLKGDASIAFEDDTVVHLHAGDYLNIPAHRKHKVIHTSTLPETIWLAVFY
ncbi:MAG: cupin domain-containing protein [Gammaproteobacteria bacterium]|nr:cupin domain-containing protein [Gammaproteobacteria bacterium]